MTSLDPLLIPEVEQERAPACVTGAGARLSAHALRRKLFNPDNAVADVGIDLQRHRKPSKPDLRRRWCEPQIADVTPPWMDQLSYENIVEKPISVKHIIYVVSNHFSIPVIDILSSRRMIDTTHARHVAMYLARRLTTYSLVQIGRFFGDRDHTTVLSAFKKVEAMRVARPTFAAELDYLAQKVSE